MTRRTGAILAACLGLACAPTGHGQPGADVAQVATIGSVTLRLETRDASCVLLHTQPDGKTTTMPLKIGVPCRFHRGAGGDIRTLKRGGVQVALAESSRPYGPNAAEPDRGLCDTRLQGIVVREGEVALSETISKVKVCLPFEWEEQMFLGFVPE